MSRSEAAVLKYGPAPSEADVFVAPTSAQVEKVRRIGFLLLELGFTVGEEGGIDCREVETAVARAYGLPGY